MIPLLLAALCTAQAAPTAIYMVLVDRFSNGDPSNDGDADPENPSAFHGGDLKGLSTHLDHIQGLGFSDIWLSPITSMRADPIGEHGAFHGYWVENGAQLEPRFGSLDDLDALQQALRKREMGLVLDLVTNHVGPDTPLTRTHPDWFHHNGDILDWSNALQVQTHDVHGLPDLAQENPAVQAHLIREGSLWSKIADGVRLDAVRHLPPAFVRSYTQALVAAKGAPIPVYGEIFEGNPVTLAEEAAQYGLKHTFDFPLYYALVDVFCRDADVRVLASVLSADRAYGAGHTHLTFLDNHDLPRIRTSCGGDEAKVQRAMELLLVLRGIPVVTYGTEAGLEGTSEVEARRDMDFARRAPVAKVIVAGLRTRAALPDLTTAPTLIEAASMDSLTMWRPGKGAALRVHFSRADGVQISSMDAPEAKSSVARPIHLGIPEMTLEEGETLWLSGSLPELGGWKMEQAVGPLKPGGTHIMEMRPGAVIGHKLLVRSAQGKARWAPGPNQYTVIPYSPQASNPDPLVRKLTWPAP